MRWVCSIRDSMKEISGHREGENYWWWQIVTGNSSGASLILAKFNWKSAGRVKEKENLQFQFSSRWATAESELSRIPMMINHSHSLPAPPDPRRTDSRLEAVAAFDASVALSPTKKWSLNSMATVGVVVAAKSPYLKVIVVVCLMRIFPHSTTIKWLEIHPQKKGEKNFIQNPSTAKIPLNKEILWVKNYWALSSKLFFSLRRDYSLFMV